MKTTLIELTNREIELALQACQSIQSGGADFDMRYTLSLNQKTLREAEADYREFRKPILLEHCEVDGRGEPQLNEQRTDYVYKSEDDQIEMLRKAKELSETAISLPLYVYPKAAFHKVSVDHNALEHLQWMIRPDKEEAEKPSKKKAKAEG